MYRYTYTHIDTHIHTHALHHVATQLPGVFQKKKIPSCKNTCFPFSLRVYIHTQTHTRCHFSEFPRGPSAHAPSCTSSILPSYAARCNGTSVSMVSFVGSKLGSSHLLGPPAKGEGASFSATPCEQHPRAHVSVRTRARTHVHAHAGSRASGRRSARRSPSVPSLPPQPTPTQELVTPTQGLSAGAGTGCVAGAASGLHLPTPLCSAPARTVVHMSHPS